MLPCTIFLNYKFCGGNLCKPAFFLCETENPLGWDFPIFGGGSLPEKSIYLFFVYRLRPNLAKVEH